MVEYQLNLDLVFNSLADSTRRDILKRVAKKAMSVSQIAEAYDLTYAAVSKHLIVMQKARLISKQRQGKQQIITAYPRAIKNAADYLQPYEALWNERFDRLDKLLAQEKDKILKNFDINAVRPRRGGKGKK